MNFTEEEKKVLRGLIDAEIFLVNMAIGMKVVDDKMATLKRDQLSVIQTKINEVE